MTLLRKLIIVIMIFVLTIFCFAQELPPWEDPEEPVYGPPIIPPDGITTTHFQLDSIDELGLLTLFPNDFMGSIARCDGYSFPELEFLFPLIESQSFFNTAYPESYKTAIIGYDLNYVDMALVHVALTMKILCCVEEPIVQTQDNRVAFEIALCPTPSNGIPLQAYTIQELQTIVDISSFYTIDTIECIIPPGETATEFYYQFGVEEGCYVAERLKIMRQLGLTGRYFIVIYPLDDIETNGNAYIFVGDCFTIYWYNDLIPPEPPWSA